MGLSIEDLLKSANRKGRRGKKGQAVLPVWVARRLGLPVISLKLPVFKHLFLLPFHL